ncbi:MAG TPA: FtsW/RodA/SpoVE family cell cycle protein, partial [Gaiellaceae bacterium]|nr:FtsW/RodA/SpoVE family cell cycle protein [Gaiellaceae bacterium]
MTARGRELAGLVLAGLVAGTALASVAIARDAEVTPGVAAYGAVFLALYLVAHAVVRRTAPFADGALLPLAAVLTAFGLTFNYRLDADDGARQALWVVIGVGVLVAVLIALRHDYRVLESYRYLFGVSAIVLLLRPSVPGLGERVNGVRLWVSVGPLQFQPGEL